jgi:hypothetical protein
MYLNIIKSYRDVVAICDSSILGKKFEEGKFQLDLKESFYKGEEVEEEKVIEILKKMAEEDATFNIVGKESITAALKAGVISKESVGRIKGIPFALILL